MNKKALVLAVGLAFATPTIGAAKALPSNLVGLSLGEIQSKSYLNEPFRGIIPILFTNSEASKKLKVKLASKSVFQKVGAEKLAILNDLTFHVDVKNNEPFITIKSTQPIQMPFLNFVLEIEGPQGSIYQDYTTLLDPRETAANTFLTKSYNVTQQSKTVLPTSVSSSSIILNASHTHKVKSGDTLSQIAQALNAADVSLKKMVTAIHTRNPNAFVNNNIDRLKAGAVLTIPTNNELKNSSFKAATKIALKDKPSSFSNSINSESSYTIKRGDNLSTITKKLGHKDVSFTKMMKAIHTANPHAFSKNKINLLKIGKVLTIPSFEELTGSNIAFKPTESVNTDPNLVTLDYSKTELTENTKEFVLDGFVVEKGDTLAKITKQIGHKSIPYSQMMHAIYVANPDAFEKNNITTLIEGAIIRLPSIAEIKEINSKNIETKPSNTTEEPMKSDSTAPIKGESSDANQKSSNTAVIKLEKRVRELKRDLNKAHSNLSNLESSLAGKENLLKQQSTDLSKLATTLELLNRSAEKSAEEKKPTPIDNNNEELQQILAELSTPESPELDNTFSNEPSETETTDTATQTDIIKSEVLATTRNGYIPVEINQKISQNITNKLAEYSQYMSGKELFATILALLFGLVLIRYRREIYAYTNISYDYPKYYPPFGEEEAKALLKEKTINFQDTLIDTPSDIHEENKPEFTDEHIQECEELAEELIEDLELKTSIHSDNTDWDELDKVCDSYIEEYKESSIVDITDVSDNLIEDAKSEPEEMTFEVFEALAEGIDKKESISSSSIVEDDTMIYGLNNDQAELQDIFEDKQPLPFNELDKLSEKIDKERIQAS